MNNCFFSFSWKTRRVSDPFPVNSFDSEKDLTMETCAVCLINKQRIVCLLSE